MKHLSSSLSFVAIAIASASTAQAQSVLARCTGSGPYAGLGSSIAVLGDVDGDGDGAPELAIAAQGERAVHVVSGASGVELFHVTDPYTGGFSTFGVRVRSVGDVDGDERADFIVRS